MPLLETKPETRPKMTRDITAAFMKNNKKLRGRDGGETATTGKNCNLPQF